MAGLPWIKVWTVVGRHPKVQRLERELALEDALGLVVRLWCWTADYHPDGDVPDHDADGMVAEAIGDLQIESAHVTHRNARVTQALVSAGLLDPIPGGFRVHDWQDMQTVHVEAQEKRKAQARERQARFRAKRSVTGERDLTRDVTRDSVTETETEKETEKERETDRQTARLAGVESFRSQLQSRLGVPRLTIGKNPKAVLDCFESQLRAVGEDALLVECCDLARKSTNGVPSSLAWFVGWLERLPAPEVNA